MAQATTSESVSSIYHCFDSHMRYSGSEPINPHLKVLENQFNMKSNTEDDEKENSSKASVNQIPFTNNFEQSSSISNTKETDANLISSASIIKDNQVKYISGSSLNNNNKSKSKKKMLASSDSDFFSLLRYNSEKLRRINCFSIGTNNNNSNSNNKPKNMIYALSDSDFLIGINDKNKNLNSSLNNERKSQAIVNKSDIFNFLINQKNIDYKNLLDNTNNCNIAQNNQKNSDVEFSKKEFNPDLFNMEKLKAVFGESEEKSMAKKETVSLPPITNANNEKIVLLNNSQSIDTVLLNIKNNADKMSTINPSYDFTNNRKPPQTDLPAVSMSESLRKLNDSTSIQENLNLDDANLNKSCTKCYDPVTLDDKNITRRKRTPSTVTYNVNVINFQADDEIDTMSRDGGGGGYGKRSNSSTSKFFCPLLSLFSCCVYQMS
jgi:hypothetical protein